MSDLKKILRDVGYFGVGAAAVVAEAGGKVIKALVDKGEKTLHDNQDTVDEIVRKTKEFGEKVKDAVEKAAASVEAPEEPAAPEASEAPEAESCCECESPEAVQADDQPVVPDAIYRTAEPVPEEDAVPEEDESAEEPAESAEPAAEEPAAEAPAPEKPAAGEIPVLNIPEDSDPKEFLNRY